MVRISHVHMCGCTGCLISFADTYEKLLDILGAVDLVYAITLADELTKVTETEDKIVIERTYPDNIDIALVEGSVCLDDHHSVELIKEVREKSKLIVALGSCAATGGVTRLGRGGQNPQPTHVSFVPVAEVVKVDFALPGCPPSTDAIVKFVMAALEGDTDYLELYADFAKYTDASGDHLVKQVISQGLCMGAEPVPPHVRCAQLRCLTANPTFVWKCASTAVLVCSNARESDCPKQKDYWGCKL